MSGEIPQWYLCSDDSYSSANNPRRFSNFQEVLLGIPYLKLYTVELAIFQK
jgi:hypothetical protein